MNQIRGHEDGDPRGARRSSGRQAYLGVDAGGTQTRARVVDVEGRRCEYRAGPANWTLLGPKACIEVLAEVVDGALRALQLEAGSLIGACIALAGYYPHWH